MPILKDKDDFKHKKYPLTFVLGTAFMWASVWACIWIFLRASFRSVLLSDVFLRIPEWTIWAIFGQFILLAALIAGLGIKIHKGKKIYSIFIHFSALLLISLSFSCFILLSMEGDASSSSEASPQLDSFSTMPSLDSFSKKALENKFQNNAEANFWKNNDPLITLISGTATIIICFIINLILIKKKFRSSTPSFIQKVLFFWIIAALLALPTGLLIGKFFGWMIFAFCGNAYMVKDIRNKVIKEEMNSELTDGNDNLNS